MLAQSGLVPFKPAEAAQGMHAGSAVAWHWPHIRHSLLKRLELEPFLAFDPRLLRIVVAVAVHCAPLAACLVSYHSTMAIKHTATRHYSRVLSAKLDIPATNEQNDNFGAQTFQRMKFRAQSHNALRRRPYCCTRLRSASFHSVHHFERSAVVANAEGSGADRGFARQGGYASTPLPKPGSHAKGNSN